MILNKRESHDSPPSLNDMRVGRAKEILSRWMGGENLDIAAKEIARLVKFEVDLKEFSAKSLKVSKLKSPASPEFMYSHYLRYNEKGRFLQDLQ